MEGGEKRNGNMSTSNQILVSSRLRKHSSRSQDNEEYDSDLSSLEDEEITDRNEHEMDSHYESSSPVPLSSSYPKGNGMIHEKNDSSVSYGWIIWTRIKALPRRTALISLLMFVLGCFFLSCATLCYYNCRDRGRSIGFFVAGGSLFLPGVYAMFIICHVVFRPESGFTMEQL